jgi:hypothetical protein
MIHAGIPLALPAAFDEEGNRDPLADVEDILVRPAVGRPLALERIAVQV